METGTTVSCFKELLCEVKGNRKIILCCDYLARPRKDLSLHHLSFILFLLSHTYKNVQIDQVGLHVTIIYLLGLDIYPTLILYS